MTLYWWMHWFWITALTTCVQRSISQTLPTVQNGHQNGPYAAKAPLEDRSQSYVEEQHRLNVQQFPHYSTERSASTNGKQLSELQQDSTPVFTLAPTEVEHLLPTFKSQPVDLLHLEAKESMHENSHFPEINGHDTYGKNFDHMAGALSDTISVPNKEKYDKSSTILVDEKPRRDELMHGNQSNQKINTGEEQLLGDQPQSDPLDAFNISESAQANLKKSLATANITTDNSPTNKSVGHNYRGKSVNMEKKMQDKPRNLTASKTKSENVPVLYVTPIPVNIFTKEMKTSEEDEEEEVEIEEEEENITESNNSVSRMPLSKENISITLPTNESLVTISPDLVVRSLATTENNTSKDSVLQAVSRERIGQNNDGQGLDAASITGIALGILASAALVGTVSFILYRRRYLNKPQTLNDSNPDSSGYLDDNTLRENSEEMYSLDNDSFLNSLEAMTIQNYWTDSVKHTKL